MTMMIVRGARRRRLKAVLGQAVTWQHLDWPSSRVVLHLGQSTPWPPRIGCCRGVVGASMGRVGNPLAIGWLVVGPIVGPFGVYDGPCGLGALLSGSDWRAGACFLRCEQAPSCVLGELRIVTRTNVVVSQSVRAYSRWLA